MARLKWLKLMGINARSVVEQIAASMRYAVLVFVSVCFLFRGWAVARTGPIRNVLVLNSYHRGYYWSDNIMDAIQNEFDKTDLNVKLFFEYLDTKRYRNEDVFPYLKELYRSKFKSVKFDVIISSDNNALVFLLENREALFPGVPIVFCGVQDFEDSMLERQDLITGVFEEYDYVATLETALKLHGLSMRVVVITEDEPTNFAYKDELTEVIRRSEREIELVAFSLLKLTMAELLEKIEELGDESVVLLASAFKDREGNLYGLEDSAAMIRQHCTAPIYVTGFQWLGLGPVGGKLTNGLYQGQAAANMAIQILNGKNPQNIPILWESPNVYMFDYKQLKHFGISPSKLPEGSIIVNEPQSLYYRYKTLIWIVSGIIAGLTTIVIVLSANILRRKKAEQDLKRSENKYKTLLENLPQRIFLKDKSSVYISCNENYAEDLGIKPEEIAGKTDYDFYPKELAEKYRADDKRILESGQVEDIEENYIRQGQEIIVHTVKTPLIDEEENALGLLGIFWDITERKKKDEKLKESEQRFRAIFDYAADGIVLADVETKKLYTANKVTCQMLGYNAEDIKNLTVMDIHPEEQLNYVMEQFEKQARKKGTLARDIPVKRKNGSVFYADINAFPITLFGKTYLMGIFRDITEHRNAEEALRQSEEKYRSLIENIGIGVSLISPKMEILALNRQQRQWFPDINVSQKPLCYRTFNNPPREGICPWCPTYKSLQDGHVHESVTETPAGGKIKNYRIIASPIKDKDGSVIGAIEMVEDITELKQRKEELDMYREKMARAEQLASLGTLSATLAHELTQPLTVIRLSIENMLAELEETACPDTVTEELKDGLASVDNAASIVERFRNFARKSSERLFCEIDLGVVVKKIVELLNESAKRAKMTVIVKNMTRLPPVWANQQDMEQFIFAMIQNAMQAGGGKKNRRLTISGVKKDEHIEVRFADNCGGIAPENLDKIFQPFFTTGSDGTRTGLGLCIVQRILSECGGKISVDSKFGKGTTFYVTLPVHSNDIQ